MIEGGDYSTSQGYGLAFIRMVFRVRRGFAASAWRSRARCNTPLSQGVCSTVSALVLICHSRSACELVMLLPLRVCKSGWVRFTLVKTICIVILGLLMNAQCNSLFEWQVVRNPLPWLLQRSMMFAVAIMLNMYRYPFDFVSQLIA